MFEITDAGTRAFYYTGVNASTDGGNFALCCNHLVFIDAVEHDAHGKLYAVEIYKSKSTDDDFQVPADIGQIQDSFDWVKTVLFSDRTDAVNFYIAEVAGRALDDRLRDAP